MLMCGINGNNHILCLLWSEVLDNKNLNDCIKLLISFLIRWISCLAATWRILESPQTSLKKLVVKALEKSRNSFITGFLNRFLLFFQLLTLFPFVSWGLGCWWFWDFQANDASKKYRASAASIGTFAAQVIKAWRSPLKFLTKYIPSPSPQFQILYQLNDFERKFAPENVILSILPTNQKLLKEWILARI